jgi:hypothetical protein
VEPPGTAPGSDPFITGAFIAIVRANPNSFNIGSGAGVRKRTRAIELFGPHGQGVFGATADFCQAFGHRVHGALI